MALTQDNHSDLHWESESLNQTSEGKERRRRKPPKHGSEWLYRGLALLCPEFLFRRNENVWLCWAQTGESEYFRTIHENPVKKRKSFCELQNAGQIFRCLIPLIFNLFQYSGWENESLGRLSNSLKPRPLNEESCAFSLRSTIPSVGKSENHAGRSSCKAAGIKRTHAHSFFITVHTWWAVLQGICLTTVWKERILEPHRINVEAIEEWGNGGLKLDGKYWEEGKQSKANVTESGSNLFIYWDFI